MTTNANLVLQQLISIGLHRVPCTRISSRSGLERPLKVWRQSLFRKFVSALLFSKRDSSCANSTEHCEERMLVGWTLPGIEITIVANLDFGLFTSCYCS